MPEPLTEADIVGHVGRAAAARCAGGSAASSTADLSRRHTVRASRQRCGHRHRRQAHDLPAHGRRHGRRGRRRARSARGRRSRTKKLPLLGAEGYDRTAGARGAERRTSTSPAATAPRRRRVLALVDATTRARRAARARAALPAGRGGLRGAPRDGHARSTTCSSRRTRARLLGRDASAAAAADVARADRRRARLGRRRAARGRSRRTAPRSTAERDAAGLPGARARRVDRRVACTRDLPVTSRPTHAADRARGAARGGHEPARRRRAVEVDDALLDRLRAACADGAPSTTASSPRRAATGGRWR